MNVKNTSTIFFLENKSTSGQRPRVFSIRIYTQHAHQYLYKNQHSSNII